MANVYVGFSPNDFFYADNPNNHYKPTPEECTTILNTSFGDASCSAWFSDNSLNCIKRQICLNEKNVTSLNNVDTEHTTNYAKNTNNSLEFQDTFLNTINLGIGILFIIFSIFKIQSTGKKNQAKIES
jgi:hypothetical protein